jgi:hypothetical protein
MKNLLGSIAVITLVVVAIGCQMTPSSSRGLSMVFKCNGGVAGNVWSLPVNSKMVKKYDSRDISVPSTSLDFAFGLEANQSGVLVAGNSNDSISTLGDDVTTVGTNGVTWGSNNASESFTLPDPNVISTQPAGTVFTPPYGVFEVNTQNGASTQLSLQPDSGETVGNLTSINEVVMRLSIDNAYSMPGTTLICAPHLIYYSSPKTYTTYADEAGNLLINGQLNQVQELEYIVFAPGSVVGSGFTYLVSGANGSTVADPVLGDQIVPVSGQPNSKQFQNPPSSWTVNPNWVSDSADNAGLFAMLDKIAGLTSPSQRAGSSQWQSLAPTFRVFL